MEFYALKSTMMERLFGTPALPPADFFPDILKELLNHRGPA